MDNSGLIKLERIFKTLGNRKRLALLICLLEGERKIDPLSQTLGLPYKTAERNLINLQEAGFLKKRTYKNKSIFSLNENANNDYHIIMHIIKSATSKEDIKMLAKSLLSSIKTFAKDIDGTRKRLTIQK